MIDSKRPSTVVDDTNSIIDIASNIKASVIIFSGLGDKILRTVLNVRKDTLLIIKNLNERYASSKLSTRKSLMSSFRNMVYKEIDID